jgi:aryl-alcohol dehydrogenase-like predicted oxidoreductase
MEYRVLGNTDMSVSRFTLGFEHGQLGSPAFHLSPDAIGSIVARALDSGINSIDVPDIDAFDQQEEVIGRLIGNERSSLVISTKIGSRISRSSPDPGGSFDHMIRSVESGLKTLGTDYFDLLLIHLDNVFTRIDENLDALANLVERGLVRFAGFYNFSVWRASYEFRKLGKPGYDKFVAAQMYYSILDRELEYDVALSLLDENIGLQVRGRPGNECSSVPEMKSDYSSRQFDAETCLELYRTLCGFGAKHGNTSPDTIARSCQLRSSSR